MTALTHDRATPQRGNDILDFPIAAGATIFRGAMVGVDSTGFAHPAGSVAGLTIVGRAETGSADFLSSPALPQGTYPAGTVIASGTPSVRVKRGWSFAWVNSTGGDAIGAGDFGAKAYAVDDCTVAKTDGSGTRAVAGTIRGVDAAGVWVQPA